MWITYFCLVSAVCCVKSLWSCLCHPVDCSLPGSSVHGILQARVLEWVAMPSSRKSSQTRPSTFFKLCHFGIFCYVQLNLIWKRQMTNIFWESRLCGISAKLAGLFWENGHCWLLKEHMENCCSPGAFWKKSVLYFPNCSEGIDLTLPNILWMTREQRG